MNAFQKLTKCLEDLEQQINKVFVQETQQAHNLQSVFEDIQTDMEENISKTLDILESTSKGLGFTITILRIISEEHFEFNSQISIGYRNLKFTGNEKQIIANEQINEKFVLPVLQGKQAVSIQIWKIEQEKQVYETFKINLRDIIGMESLDNNYQLSAKSLNNPERVLYYSVQVKGFGFNSWKRQNLDEQIVEKQNQGIPQQSQNTEPKPKNPKAQQQKKGLNELFEKRTAMLAQTKLQSFDTHMSELDEIMNILADI